MRNEKIYGFVLPIVNIYLAVSVILFTVYLVSPLVDGKIPFDALIIYGSWIGMAIVMKFVFKKRRDKIVISKIQWLLVALYGILCMFLWFLTPLNFFFSGLIITGNIIGYKTQRKYTNSTF